MKDEELRKQVSNFEQASKNITKKRALEEIENIANSGSDKAWYWLGILYLDGNRWSADIPKGISALKSASELGNKAAMNSLSWRYWNGQQVPRNRELGASYAKLAAEQGVSLAALTYGRARLRGIGVDQDKADAFYWIEEAAKNSDTEAAQKLGAADAKADLALLYLKGDGCSKAPDKYLELIQQSAEEGSEFGHFLFGRELMLGETIDQDVNASRKHLTAAASAGMPEAQYVLAVLLEGDQYGFNEKDAAFNWLQLAAEQGDSNSQRELGHRYKRGISTNTDFVKAFEWYLKSAQQGDVSAALNVGNFYHAGSGTPIDLVKACEWWRKGAEAGNELCRLNLADAERLMNSVSEDRTQEGEYTSNMMTRPARKTIKSLGQVCQWCGEDVAGEDIWEDFFCSPAHFYLWLDRQ
ncbi:tetratricopeptide repeat protein [Parerythrobacter jejuensis]|uniref:tetratricopeptide repeat protein n=1 Tax=Parerythrobacter jejuensis TaxID=795812 RepID=UPI001369F946|nr:tetratricopeptide repeat protein [Parerythrobacter jejuensis]